MKKVAIIGAGISGLFIANLFKRNKKYQVNIFERNSSINSKENQKFSSAYWFDRKKIDSYILPSFTKKVVKYLEKN